MSELVTAVKILTEPLALVGWLMAATLLAAVRLRRPGPLRAAAAIALAVYFALCTPLGANLLIGPLEARAAGDAACNAPVIVVLTGGARRGATDAADFESLHLASFRRAVAAVYAAQARPDAHVVVAGGGEARVSEAAIMAALIARLGVSPERLVVEKRSRTTREAAPEVAAIVRRLGARQITLVTSAAHVPRARWVLERQGLSVCPLPTDHQYVRPEFPGFLLPQLTALQKSTTALHEYVGLALYAVLDSAPPGET